AADPHVGQLLVPGEGEDAGVLEEAAEDRADADVLAQPRDPGAQRADAADDDVDLDPRLARPVQRVDDGLVDDRVDLDLDPRRAARAVPGDLPLDALDEPGAYGAR